MTAALRASPQVDRGAAHWVRSWRLLVQWEWTSLRMGLPMVVIVQSLVGAGSVLAIALWFDAVPPGAGLYVTTGGATITLLQVGMVMGPQLVAGQRLSGTYDFTWSLPTPRSAAMAAWLTLNLVIAVPGLVLTFVIGTLVYDLDLAISASIVPAVALTIVTGTSLGYAIAHGVSRPTVVNLVSQVFIFGLFGFSPILFPDRNLPDWLASLHRWLPVQSMADLVRAGVTDGLIDEVARAYVVVSIWGVVCIAISAVAIGRRK